MQEGVGFAKTPSSPIEEKETMHFLCVLID